MKETEEIKHVLVPPHELLKAEEIQTLIKRYNISISQLPRVYYKDPAVHHLDVKSGDVIRIIRQSPTAGKSIFYRLVVDDG